jgi:PAS domain S-box-containing protein
LHKNHVDKGLPHMVKGTKDDQAFAFSDGRYRALFEDNPVMIAILDRELKILSVNPICASQLGYCVEELEGQSVLLLFQEDERPAVVDQLHKCLEHPKQVYHWQFHKVRKDGGVVWVEETAQAVPDLNGELNILVVCQDITDRKRAEGEREQLLLQLEAVLDNINEGVVITDMEGNVVKMNQEALSMHGFEGEAPIYRQLSEYQDIFEITDFAGEVVPLEEWPMSRALRGDKFTDYEIIVRRKDTGKSLVGSYSGRPVMNELGNIILAVVTMRDVTELKRVREDLQRDKEWLEQKVKERTANLNRTIEILKDEVRKRIIIQRALEAETLERRQMQEELREKEVLLLQQSRLAAMGEMIGNIAHQWRQPLNVTGLLAQELVMRYKRRDFDKQYLEGTVKKMMQAINYMSKTIDDFRNFFSPDKEKVDFKASEMVEKAVSLMEISLKSQNITTSVISMSDPVVHGYPSEYAQVLLNIIGNARDALVALHVDHPTINIEVGTDGGRSVVTITDNAGGIPEGIIDNIFDPYFTTKGPDKGTGIGLYMSKVIIEKNMGGLLLVQNVGSGARFRIVV